MNLESEIQRLKRIVYFLQRQVTTSGSGGAVWGAITGTLSSQSDLNTALNGKQATLVSGTNIKTINGNSVLGSGNLVIGSTPTTSNVLIDCHSSK